MALSGPPALRAQPDAAEEAIFVELEGSGFDFVHFNGMSGEFYMAEINCGGGGFLDYDGDGDLDLYLVQGAMLDATPADRATFPPRHPLPLTDRLYRNDLEILPDGTRRPRFVDVTARSGVEVSAYGFGVAAGDYDDDGDVDLYVTNLGSNALLRNNGDGTFSDAIAGSGADDDRWSVPAIFTDYDRDGRLDLFVGNYLDFTVENHKVCRTATGAPDYCGPSAYAGVPNSLFRNLGGGRFEDVTLKTGLGLAPSKTLGAVAADLNGDGRVDLYVANDQEANQMWIQNERGGFSDEALLAGTAFNRDGKAEASMGVDAGDFDGDGDDDLFMTHLTRETNTLYLNDGTGMFEDATISTGLGPPSFMSTSWGTAWFDYDGDGRLEMMVANGAVRVIEELLNAGDPYPFHQPNQLFHNLGDGRFEEVTDRAGPTFRRSEVSRALAVGDLDNDGDDDVLLVNNNGPARILLNDGSPPRWLGARLLGGPGPRDMLGARAALLRPGRPALWRRVRSDGSFAAANDPRLLFGLGDGAESGTLRVLWPNSRVMEWTGLEAGRYTVLREGSGATR